MQKGIIKIKNPVSIAAAASVVGKREYEGPLGGCFDAHDNDDTFGMSTWEQSESEMQRRALNFALSKKKLCDGDLDLLLAGDLINQCTSSTYGLLSFDVPYIGLFGACSTVAEALLLTSLLIGNKIYKRAAAVTSSHNCSAERQFRFPLEYGGQRTPTSQWTVTGAGAYIIDDSLNGPFVTEVMPGRVIDRGINDANNMGAAMAPAVIDTLTRYFTESKLGPSSFDLILTGDLGFEGHSIVLELMRIKGYDMEKNYSDCGLLIFDREKQDMHAGGSGCGCSAVVLAGHILPELNPACGRYKKILFIGTGALMSPMSLQQGQSIPGIAHLIKIESVRS